MAGELISPNLELKTFVDFSRTEPHDAETGLSVRFHTLRQRESYLRRNPSVDPVSLPPVRDPNARVDISDAWGSVCGSPLMTPERIRYEARRSALLSDPSTSLARREPTKPKIATELSKYRLCLHEASHSCLASLAFGRPIVRVTINPSDDGDAGHVWHYRTGDATRDDLIILAAGRAAEEILLGDVHEPGCSADDEKIRELALKISNGDIDEANNLLREADAAARGLVKQYDKTIRRFALRLAAKREFILDEAEAAIRQAHEEVTQHSEPVRDAEWERKLARHRASQLVREYVEQRKPAPAAKTVRTYDCNDPKDVRDLLKKFPGLGNGGQDYLARDKR